MKKWLFFFLFVLVHSPGFSFENRGPYLHFIANDPQHYQSKLEYIKTTSIKEKEDTVLQGSQKIGSSITVLEDQKEDSDEISFLCTFEQFSNQLRQKDFEVSFDSKALETAIEIAQASKIANRPFKFLYSLDQGLEGTEEYEKAIMGMPALQDLKLFAAIQSFLEEMFSLYSRELVEGEKFTFIKNRPFYDCECVYTIKEIKDKKSVLRY